MKPMSLALSLILTGLISTVVSCDSSDSNKSIVPAAKTGFAEIASIADGALVSAGDSPGKADNNEGVNQFRQGHMDAAFTGFQNAVKADPKLAEAQYNLGLSLDKLGKHDEATIAFKQAVALAPENFLIKDSPILKKHLGA